MHIEFHGAAGEVTGSCYLVDTGRHRLLLECGLIQGSPAEETRNRKPFPFDPGTLDAVVLSHAHLDHSGRLPLLVAAGYRGPIYAQRACRDLCEIMLRDAAHLNERDAEWESRKRARRGRGPVEPLYTRRHAERAMGQFRDLDYEVEREILPGVRLRFRDAGHILGSAIVELTLADGEATRRIVFSGDLGHAGAPILRDPAIVTQADLVLLESTYGDRAHRGWDGTWKELGQVFRDAEKGDGNILIPSFAIGRAQELLYVFKQHFDEWGLARWTFFLDSPMAIEATEVYARHWRLHDIAANEQHGEGGPFKLPNLHFSRTAVQSMAINRVRSGAVIVAGSGMCDGGRIRHHLKHNLWRENCHLVFVGFQAAGTLGRRIVDGARSVRLWGETIRVAARVHTIGGLSAHADQAGLLAWARELRGRPPMVLVHGEPEATRALARELRSELGVRVLLPSPGARLDLRALRWTRTRRPRV